MVPNIAEVSKLPGSIPLT